MAELRSFLKQAKSFADTLNSRGLVTYAASCAYYTFLSLFPLTALAASLVPCMGVSEAALFHLLDSIAPAGVAALLKAILANVYQYVFPALPLSMLVLLWSSTRAFSELLKGMTALAAADSGTGYLKRRLRAVLLTLALLLTLLLSLAVLIFGARSALFLVLVYPQAAGLLKLASWLRYLVMGTVLWLLFIFLYRSIPGLRLSFREAKDGAALAAAAWVLFSGLFSLYADRYMDLTLYGSLAAMALTMLWLFYCQYIVLIGAGFCSYRRTKKEAVPVETAS